MCKIEIFDRWDYVAYCPEAIKSTGGFPWYPQLYRENTANEIISNFKMLTIFFKRQKYIGNRINSVTEH